MFLELQNWKCIFWFLLTAEACNSGFELFQAEADSLRRQRDNAVRLVADFDSTWMDLMNLSCFVFLLHFGPWFCRNSGTAQGLCQRNLYHLPCRTAPWHFFHGLMRHMRHMRHARSVGRVSKIDAVDAFDASNATKCTDAVHRLARSGAKKLPPELRQALEQQMPRVGAPQLARGSTNDRFVSGSWVLG